MDYAELSAIKPSSLAYPSPSLSSDSLSLADSEYVTASEWSSMASSRAHSPTTNSQSVAPAQPIIPTDPAQFGEHARWMPPAETTVVTTKPPRTEPSTSRKRHVPRPPNAFMLFRSMMINTQIPKIENRQQNVSRIAGEIWNKLPEPIKQAWHSKAEEVQRVHRQKYPDYKFAPSRKAALKAKEEEEGEGRNKEDYIRHLREKYMGVMGPAVAPARKRKPKSRKPKCEDDGYTSSPRSARSKTSASESSPESSRPASSSPHYPSLDVIPPWRNSSQDSSLISASMFDLGRSQEYYGKLPTLCCHWCHRPLSDAFIRAALSRKDPSFVHDDKTPTADSFDQAPSASFDRTPTNASYDQTQAAASYDHTSPATRFDHYPIPSAFAPGAGTSLTAFQHNMLGLGDLALPPTNMYSHLYPDVPQYLSATPTHHSAPATLPEYGFPYDDIFNSGVPGSSGGAGSSSASSPEEERNVAFSSGVPLPLDPPNFPTPGTNDDPNATSP